MKEKDKIPVGLTIEKANEACNITITLGDDVNLGKIVDYLFDEKHIKQIAQDENGIFYKSVNNATITIKMCDKDKNDTYSVTMKPCENGHLFKYDKKDKGIYCNDEKINKHKGYYRFVCQNNCISCDTIDNEKLLTGSVYSLFKDIKGNLSWRKITKDGKVYMCNAVGKNRDPDRINENEWKPIRHTFWSNIHNWYKRNIDEFNDEIKKQTSKIKRFGRLFISQQNMTGDWLCGQGCCSFTPSGYNEYDFYEEKPNDNTESRNNINNNLSQNIINH